ncbi:MAG: hypothetical protein VYE40_15490 [Myxococcota bacterium]|jgi:hypothetical protein|nr:hypothetical protein [Myxococcota bacterium]
MAQVDVQQDDALKDVIEEQESLKRHRAKLKTDLSTIFHTFDRFITMMRVYPLGHPLIEGFAEQTLQHIQRYCESEGSLAVRLKPRELQTEWGDTFFTSEESERDHFLWYAPAADGMVELEFLPEITSRDLISLLEVINRADLGKLPLDDDTITLLWERDLKSIEYAAIEGYIDMGELGYFGGLSEPEAKATVMTAAINPSGEAGKKLATMFEAAPQTQVDVFTRIQVKAKPLDSLTQMPADMLADAFRVDTSWVNGLVEEWLTGNNLEYRLIEALLSIVRVQPDSEHSQRAVDTIFQITTQLLDNYQYNTVITLMKLLHARRKLFEGDAVDPLGDLLGYISDPLRLEALIFQAQRRHEDRKDIIRLLKILDKDQVQKHILTTLATENKKPSSTEALVDVLLAVLTKENERNLLRDEYMNKTCYLERLLPHLRGRSPTKYPILPRLMGRAIESEDRSVRALVLQLAHNSWCTPMVIDKYIKPLLSDDDNEVRRLAIAVMRDLASKDFEAWLQTVITEQELGFRKPGEVRFLVRLYLEQYPQKRAELRAMLQTRGWFNEQRRDLARSVAIVLLEHGDREAIEIIQTLADSFFTSRSLREEYRKLLGRFAEGGDEGAEDARLRGAAQQLLGEIDRIEKSEASVVEEDELAPEESAS